MNQNPNTNYTIITYFLREIAYVIVPFQGSKQSKAD